jgi:acetyl esterase/lipase
MTGILQQAIAPETALWRGMDRATLDIAYNNSAHVTDSAERLAEWSRRSAALRARQPALLDRPYGLRERNRIDLFRCGHASAPLLVFIHGGYWQRNSKEVFSCMAEGPLACGFDVALPGYTLAPEASLTQIVAEIRSAIAWLRREGPAFGVATQGLVASGWSAGGHLAATSMAWPEVDAGLSISGIFDLEPIRLGALNDRLALSPGEAFGLSPLHHWPERAGRLVVAYGTAELPELQRQSRDYAGAWQAHGLPGKLLPVEDRNHFSILDELVAPEGRLTRSALALLA